MTLSIVIVNFNARADLENCLRSLAEAPPAIPHDVTIVDNASTDGSPAAVRSGWPAVRLIELAKNVGFSAGNNAGIRATRGELILLLNNDTIVPPGAIDRLVARLQAHREAAVAGPRLVDGSGRLEISFGPMISPFAELRQKTIGRLYDRGFGPRRALGGPRVITRALRRLGQRRVPARVARRRRGRRPARRALLPLYRGRRLLRRQSARRAGASSSPRRRRLLTCGADRGRPCQAR